MDTKANPNSGNWKFIMGILLGLAVTVVANFLLVQFQSYATKSQMKMQLFLDEKAVFVDACNEYLNQYRDWHELMNYHVNKKELISDKADFTSEFDSTSAAKKYKLWKKDFDRAYGSILLLSDNEFGLITMEVSTVLHSALKNVIHSDTLSPTHKHQILIEVDFYFFDTWLRRAKEEIRKYNSGERIEKSLDEWKEEVRQSTKAEDEYEKWINNSYEDMKRANNYMRKRDSTLPEFMTKEQYRAMMEKMNSK